MPLDVRIDLPAQLQLHSATQLYAKIADTLKGQDIGTVTIDFARMRFISHDGVTMLANYLELLRKNKTTWQPAHLNIAVPAISYLDDCGFFEHFLGHRLNRYSKVRDTTMPFTSIETERHHAWIENNLCPWICGILGVGSPAIDELRASLREVFNNITDHSTEQIGCVHAQYYPRDNSLGISISDFGIGIPRELSKEHAFATDGEALLLASQEGVTSKAGRNRGAGLSMLIDSVVGINGGSVTIHSGRGSLACDNSPQGITRKPSVLDSYYPGTFVSIRLRTDRITNQPEEREDLQW